MELNGKMAPTVLMLAIVFCVLGGFFVHDYLVASGIQHHGERQEAKVLDIFQQITHHRRTSDTCAVIADYQITPNGWSSPLPLQASLGGCYQGNPSVVYVMQNHTLPVAYDVTDPHVSRVNFGDGVFRQDAAATMKWRILVLAACIGFAVFVVTAADLIRSLFQPANSR